MTTEGKPLPAEGGHWYDRQGNPVYEVPCSSKDGMRPTTIRDAVKLDLVPSVTAVLGVAAKPGLEAWKAKQILEASLTLPQLPGETLDDYALRVMEDAKAQSKAAADKGTQLHAAIEKAILGEDFDILWREHVEKTFSTVAQQCGFSLFDSKAEHSFASPLGYGGKIDAHTDEPLICDFKTKERIDDKKQLAWPEHIQQLAAYGMGLFGTSSPTALSKHPFRALNVFIGVNDKEVRVIEYEWPDIVEAFAQFRCLLEYWQRCRKFGPYAKLSIHHKNCGGELYIKQWTDYGSDGDVTYGVLPDYYCRKCDAFIMGDAQIKESMDDIQFGLSKKAGETL